MGEKSGEYPNVLKRLVFSALSLSHGQAFVERGFNTTKWILKGNRGNMSMECFTAQKRMKDVCEKYGGAGFGPLAHSLLVQMRLANTNYHKWLEKEKKEKEAERDRQREEEENIKRKRKAEEEKV